MLPGINDLYLKKKEDQANHRFIVESVLSEDEIVPGSDEEFEDIVDADSVPDDVYAAIDKTLDKFIDDPEYDDTEAEELVDDDDELFLDGIGVSDGAIEAIMDEAADIMEQIEEAETGGDTGMAMNEHVADFGGLDALMNENYSQFTNGKFQMKGGQAYKPITTNPYVTDESKIEEEALRESASSMDNLNDWAMTEGVGQAIKRGAYHAAPTAGGAAAGGVVGAATGAVRGYMSKEARQLRKHAKEMAADPDADEDSIRDAKEIAKAVSKRKAIEHAKKYGAVGAAVGGTHGVAYTAGRSRGYKKGYDDGDRNGYADGVEDGKAGVVESTIYAAIAEGISNPDMEDFPGSTGTGNDHGARMNDFESHEAPDDFPNSTGGKSMDSGDEPTNRYKAVAEAAIRRFYESVTNTDVEDFPGSEGTHTAEGSSYAPGMSHTDDSKIYGYGDSSDYEQREVDTEDGGRDAIDITKANESAYRYMRIAEGYADSASTAGGTRICEPGVECPGDFPRALPREVEGQAAGWGDESDYERREVGVEDGGESAIDVIKANESAKYRLW